MELLQDVGGGTEGVHNPPTPPCLPDPNMASSASPGPEPLLETRLSEPE